MKDFEKRLKTLALKEPPSGLRERIFGKEEEPERNRGFLFRRIPLAWAAGVALLMWFLGFFAARLIEHPVEPSISPAPSVVDVRIIYEFRQQGNIFDFTNEASDFLPGKYQVQVENNGEV